MTERSKRALRQLSPWSFAEPPRAAVEAVLFSLATPFLQQAPRGDHHPVLVLPGFGTNDWWTAPLCRYLRDLGYDAYAWELGRNLGPRSIGSDGALLAHRIAAVRHATGQKISLVGWSLGGLMARAAAQRQPEHIRQLICLGSPVHGNPRAIAGARLYEWLTGQSLASCETRRQLAALRRPVPVPSTAIYSRSDGVAHWRDCVERSGLWAENIEVYGSHWGLPVNPAVLYAIADRLALPDGTWQPFDRSGWRSLLYSAPAEPRT